MADSFTSRRVKMLLKISSTLLAKWAIALVIGSALNLPALASELPPLKLMSPLSSVSLDSLAGEADSAYANKQFKAAADGFRSIIELDGGNRRALFRLGNIFQQQGNNEQAMTFYRQASQATEYSQQLDEFGEKALINIALLAAEQLKQALAELEKRKPSAKVSVAAQGLVDDLSDSQALIAARVAGLQRPVQNPSQSQNRKAQAVDVAPPPEVINGNLKHVLKPAPRVTYSQQADPSYDSPEVTYIKGAPSKATSARSSSSTQTLYKKVVRRPAAQNETL
jgi:tetratricopeptide (TPR) repeat protein